MSSTTTEQVQTMSLAASAPAMENGQTDKGTADAQAPQTKPASDALAACATGGYAMAGIPEFEDLYKKRQWQLEHMAGAFRVFARRGFTEGTAGHISVRDPVDPSTFWINPLGVHFGMLKASDMVHVNEEGQVIGGNRVAVNAAGFLIHGAIHKARPDINAACHAHTVHGKAWSAFGRPVDIINQDSCVFLGIQAVYRAFGGVVLEADEGRRIADALGDRSRVAILQNHGLLTAGGTVDEAAYLFTSLEKTCEVQLLVESARLERHVIGRDEAEYTAKVNADPETLYAEFQPDFQYEIWKSKGELSSGL